MADSEVYVRQAVGSKRRITSDLTVNDSSKASRTATGGSHTWNTSDHGRGLCERECAVGSRVFPVRCRSENIDCMVHFIKILGRVVSTEEDLD